MQIFSKMIRFGFVLILFSSTLACQESSDTSTELTTESATSIESTTEPATSIEQTSEPLTTPFPSTTTEILTESISYVIENDITTSLGMYRFDGNFVNPQYYPIINNLTFSLEINDENYRDSTYFVIVREVNSPDYDFLQAFTIDESQVTRFHSIDYTPGKEVIVAKIEGTVYNDHVYLEPVASLLVEDLMSSSRKTISGYNIIGNSLRDIEANETPYLDFNLTANDPERIIYSIKAMVYYPDYGLVLDTKEFEVNEDMYSGNELLIENIIFDHLPPDKIFTIIYYMTGNDGVDDFEDVLVTSKRMTTSAYAIGSGVTNSYPGFWGVIHHLELNETTTRVHLHYVNDQVLSLDDEYLTASLNVYDETGNLVQSYPLIGDMSYIDIDNTYLDDYYALRIECDQAEDILAVYHIRYGFDGLDFISATYADQNLRVSYRGTWVEIVSIYIKITQVGDGSEIIEVTLSDLEEGYNDISYPQGPDGYFDQYDAYIEITYIGFKGEEVHVTGYSNR
jgi:hypothetical protein